MIRARNGNEEKSFDALHRSNQEHLLRFWEELSDSERDVLMEDIEKVDLDWVQKVRPLLHEESLSSRIIEKPDIISIPTTPEQIKAETEAESLGEALIGESKTAVFTAAGGQSSRLGLDTPKGTYPVSPVRHKSLFQVHAEKIAFLQEKYDVRIPWLVMVSEINHAQTKGYFEEKGFFGLDTAYVWFLEQGMFPAMDGEGKLLLREKNRVFLNPTGHGGTFSTLADSGALLWLKELGVQEIFYFQVDNVLVKVLDPVFLGYHGARRCEMSSKCVMKRDMGEKIGVFVIEDGALTVVEYSELSAIKLSDGSQVQDLRAGSIAIHITNVDFALQITAGQLNLPLHVAHKAIPHVDRSGRKVKPSKPNGYKFETFIFDALKHVHNTIIMEVDRGQEFSPLKNETGEDSPQTVLRDQLRFFTGWFEAAGISIPRDGKGEPRYGLEVAPSFAAFREDFLQKIDRSMRVEGDIYIG
ncbi:MAG: UTP--glucose-1-phosphate uridylyltransferase [Spirochaetes bacterium]|nr:UTP--glucose-1-phosphate uridylyltransferase [Spirochaetota bacterium]